MMILISSSGEYMLITGVCCVCMKELTYGSRAISRKDSQIWQFNKLLENRFAAFSMKDNIILGLHTKLHPDTKGNREDMAVILIQEIRPFL